MNFNHIQHTDLGLSCGNYCKISVELEVHIYSQPDNIYDCTQHTNP